MDNGLADHITVRVMKQWCVPDSIEIPKVIHVKSDVNNQINNSRGWHISVYCQRLRNDLKFVILHFHFLGNHPIFHRLMWWRRPAGAKLGQLLAAVYHQHTCNDTSVLRPFLFLWKKLVLKMSKDQRNNWLKYLHLETSWWNGTTFILAVKTVSAIIFIKILSFI